MFVGKRTQAVEFIVMVTDRFAMRAIPRAHRGTDQGVEYWTSCSRDELDPFLTFGFEVWRYDWSSVSDEPGSGSGPEFDYEDGLAWEVLPVQAWAKGEPLSRDLVASIADYMGDASEFSYDDIMWEFPEFDESGPLAVRRESPEARRCLWCDIAGVKSYSFIAPDYADYAEQTHSFDDPVLWTDGVWSHAGGNPDDSLDFPTQFGDRLVACETCSAVFLASDLESRYSQDNANSVRFRSQVSPGTVEVGELSKDARGNSIVAADFNQTLAHIERLQQLNEFSFWGQWVAAQQLVGCASQMARRGLSLTPEQDKRGREALAAVSRGIEGILEGTIGSMYAGFNSYESLHDPNYLTYQHPHEETIPLANIRRIAGDFERASYFGGGYFDSFEELELDHSLDAMSRYAEQRQWLLKRLVSSEDSRWAASSADINKRL